MMQKIFLLSAVLKFVEIFEHVKICYSLSGFAIFEVLMVKYAIKIIDSYLKLSIYYIYSEIWRDNANIKSHFVLYSSVLLSEFKLREIIQVDKAINLSMYMKSVQTGDISRNFNKGSSRCNVRK